MSQLKEKLQNILNVKNSKIIPTNIKAGTEIFGVNGSFVGQLEGVVEYNDVEALLADHGQPINTLGFVQDSEYGLIVINPTFVTDSETGEYGSIGYTYPGIQKVTCTKQNFELTGDAILPNPTNTDLNDILSTELVNYNNGQFNSTGYNMSIYKNGNSQSGYYWELYIMKSNPMDMMHMERIITYKSTDGVHFELNAIYGDTFNIDSFANSLTFMKRKTSQDDQTIYSGLDSIVKSIFNVETYSSNRKAYFWNGEQWIDEIGVFTDDADAETEDLAIGKTAYVNGRKVTGTLPRLVAGSGQSVNLQQNTPYISVTPDRTTIVEAGAGLMIDEGELATKIGLTADKLVQGNTILNIEGTAVEGNPEAEQELADCEVIANDILGIVEE